MAGYKWWKKNQLWLTLFVSLSRNIWEHHYRVTLKWNDRKVENSHRTEWQKITLDPKHRIGMMVVSCCCWKRYCSPLEWKLNLCNFNTIRLNKATYLSGCVIFAGDFDPSVNSFPSQVNFFQPGSPCFNLCQFVAGTKHRSLVVVVPIQKQS